MATLIIDVHNLVHRAAHSYKDLWSPNQEVFTGVYYGVFNMLQKYVADFRPEFVWLVSDPNDVNEKANWRSQYLPDYKRRDKTRKPEDEKRVSAVRRQMPALKAACLMTNIFWFEQPYLEADEIIGWLWNAYPESKFTLVSTDKDMFTLLRPGFNIYYPGQKRTLVLTHDNLGQHSAEFIPGQNKKAEEKKIRFHDTKEWAEYRWLDGDKSDMIPGLPKCGPAGARKIIDAGGYAAFCEMVDKKKEAEKKKDQPNKSELNWTSEEARRAYNLNRYIMSINPPPAEHVQFDMTNPRCGVGVANFEPLKDWMSQMDFADKDDSLIARLRSSPLLLPKHSPYEPLRSY